MTPPRRPSNERNLPIVVGLCAIVLAIVGWLWMTATSNGEASLAGKDAGDSAAPSGAGMNVSAPVRASGNLDVETIARARVRGRVHDQRGAPIEGAQVCAAGRSEEVGRKTLRYPFCARTGADGRYVLSGLLPVEFGVTASARGFQPATWEPRPDAKWIERRIWLAPGEQREDIDIELEAGGAAVAGVVRDISGGEVEGAWVTSGGAYALTDAAGSFELWVSPNDRWVEAVAPGYAEGFKIVAVPSTGNEIFLSPESVLRGRVVLAETGEPVGGVSVSSGWGWRGPGDVSDADGTFQIAGLGPGRYGVTAEADGMYGRSESEVPLGLGETSEPLTIELHPVASFEASVVIADAKGKRPCPEGFVSLHLVDGDRAHRDRFGPNDAGTATVKAILPGRYTVKASCSDFVAEEDYGEVEVGETALPPRELEVREGLAIRGTLRNSAGDPVEGYVHATPKRVDGDDARAQQTTGDGQSLRDGSFDIEGLLPGTYELRALASKQSPGTEVPVEVVLDGGADRNGVELVVDPAGSVRGTVRDEQGEPLRDLRITARSAKQGGWSFGGNDSGVTDQNGAFHIAVLRPGDYRVVASRGWRALPRPGQSDDDPDGEPVVVQAGQETTVDLVVARTDGTITGRVVADGGPVADAFINYRRMSDSKAANAKQQRNSVRWGSWGTKPILTDMDGNFTVEGLTPGSYVVQATRKGGGEGIVENVAVGADVTIEIASTGGLEGRVTTGGGSLPPSLQVTVRDEAQGLSFSTTNFRTQGRFEFNEIPAGDYEIEATTDTGLAKGRATVTAGERTLGVALELQSFVTIRGRLVDLESGEPISGLKVAASTEHGGFSFGDDGNKGNISGADGRFEVRNVPTGKGRLRVMPRSFGGSRGKYAWHWETLRLPDAPAVQDIGDVALVANRVQDGDEAGVLGFTLKRADPDAEVEELEYEVAVVRPGGPAAKAGLTVGAKITSVDGHRVEPGSLRYATLTRVKVGTTVKLGLASGETVSVTAGEPP